MSRRHCARRLFFFRSSRAREPQASARALTLALSVVLLGDASVDDPHSWLTCGLLSLRGAQNMVVGMAAVASTTHAATAAATCVSAVLPSPRAAMQPAAPAWAAQQLARARARHGGPPADG